jgi:hypothetical protein
MKEKGRWTYHAKFLHRGEVGEKINKKVLEKVNSRSA